MKEIESERHKKFASVKRGSSHTAVNLLASLVAEAATNLQTPGQVLEGAERLTWVLALPPRSPSVLASPQLDAHCLHSVTGQWTADFWSSSDTGTADSLLSS